MVLLNFQLSCNVLSQEFVNGPTIVTRTYVTGIKLSLCALVFTKVGILDPKICQIHVLG